MSLKAPKTSSSNNNNNFKAQEPLEAGTYQARVVQVIDLGLQPQRPWQGQEKPPSYQISITYELVDEFMKDEDGNDMEDKPRWISEILPLRSLSNEKAKSTQRYKVFDPNNVFGGDFTRVVETPVMVTIVNNKSGDRIYNNVGNVSQMKSRDVQRCPALVNPPSVFDLDNPDMEVFNKFPQFIKDKITTNLNYKGSKLESLIGDKSDVVRESDEGEEENAPY